MLWITDVSQSLYWEFFVPAFSCNFFPNYPARRAFFLRPHASWSGPDLQPLAHSAFSLSGLLCCPWDGNNDLEHAVAQGIHPFNLTSPKILCWDTAPRSTGWKSVFTNHCDWLVAKAGDLDSCDRMLLWLKGSGGMAEVILLNRINVCQLPHHLVPPLHW